MRRITKYGITAAAVAGLLTAGAGAAFAAPPPASGVVSGTVTVETALTLQLVGTSFTVNGAVPGVTDNGVPATVATVSTNDAGYALTAYMNAGTEPPFPGCNSNPAQAFNNAAGTASIPDDAWTDVSTGGPGAPGSAQSFPTPPPLGNGTGGCLAATPQAITVGQSNAESAATGDNYTEQLAVKVPANTPGNVAFTGSLTYLATGV